MAKEERLEEQKQTSPKTFPDTSPQSYPGSDYSFTLQGIIEMQRTMGRLEEAIKNLTEQSKTHADEIKDIGKKVYAAKVVFMVFGAILAALGSLAVFFLDKIWNAVIPLIQIKPHP